MKFKRRKVDCPTPFVAMADITFNLVLFFIIMAKTTDDRNLQWSAATADVKENIANAQARVVVDKENQVYLNGKQVGLKELSAGVSQILGNNPPENRVVLLKIHENTLAGTFEPLMEAVSQAGGEVFHVLKEERK